MTALPEYQLLEAPGFYAEGAGSEPEEVLLGFGAASLTIMRFDETPLAHWPLATLALIAREEGGAQGGALVLAPDAGAPERLRVTDPDMIAALRAVAHDFAGAPIALKARPRRRRRGLRLLLAALALCALGAAIWRAAPDPAALAARLAPARAEAALGDAAIAAFAGPDLCVPGPRGRQALARIGALADAMAPQAAPHAARALARDGSAAAMVAPGGRIALHLPVIARLDGPEALTEAVARALALAEARPPLGAALRAVGASGAASDLRAMAASLITGAPPGPLRLTQAAADALAAPGDAAASESSVYVARAEEKNMLPDAALLRAVRGACAGR